MRWPSQAKVDGGTIIVSNHVSCETCLSRDFPPSEKIRSAHRPEVSLAGEVPGKTQNPGKADGIEAPSPMYMAPSRTKRCVMVAQDGHERFLGR